MCHQILYLYRTFTWSLTQKYHKNSNCVHIFATQTSPDNDLESWLRLWWKLTASSLGSSPWNWNVISLYQIRWSHQTTCESTQGSLPSNWLPCQTQTQEDRQHLRWTQPTGPSTQQAAADGLWKLTICGFQLKASGEEFTIITVQVKQEPQRLYSHGCARCQANFATLCNILTTLCTVFMKCKENRLRCPHLKMCFEFKNHTFLSVIIILMAENDSISKPDYIKSPMNLTELH